MRRVVITGAYALTPRGPLGPEGFAQKLSGVPLPVTRFPVSDFPTQAALELPTGGQVEMGLCAARNALGDLQKRRTGHAPRQIGVFVGAEPERVTLEALARVSARAGQPEAGWEGVFPRGAYYQRSPGRLTDALAEELGAKGPRRTFSMACAACAAALASAFRAVKYGDVTLAVVVGAALNVEPLLFAGFCLLRAMSASGRCRPFDAERDGFVLGDGAGAMILEDEALVQREGREEMILGRVLGAGESLDAYRMTDPHPSGRGARAAILGALTEAGLSPSDVALVKAHATGTVQNDRVEAGVIFDLFGARPPVLALKGALGHSIAASGIIEAIAALAVLRRGVVGGTVQLRTPDPDLPPLNLAPEYDPSTGAPSPEREIPSGVALCNTFGFGGINCALLIDLP